MLQMLHERIKGWIAGVIIGAISIVFVLWGVEYYLQGGDPSGKTIAKVDGRKITEKELTLTFRQLQRQYTIKKGGLLTVDQNKHLKQLALQSLISTNVLLSSAADAGFRVSRYQVDQLITSLPQFQEEGRFSLQRYRQFLYANSLTSSEFVQRANNSLLMQQVQEGIEGSNFILPIEAKRGFDLTYQKRDFGYFVLPSARFVSAVTVSPEQIKQYYQQHRDNYKAPEKVSISYLLLSPQQVSQTVTVSDAEMKQYYEDNKGNYRTPQRWKVDRIFLPIPAGATPKQIKIAQDNAQKLVGRLSKGVSFDTLMKEQEGVSQWVSETGVSSQFVQILSALKSGQVSPAFKTPQGINIVRMVKQQPGELQPFALAKVKIHTILVQQKTNAIITKMSDQLSTITYTNPETLQSAAKVLNIPVQTTDLFTQKGLKKGIASDSKVVAAAFSDDVLQGGNNSNVISLNNGGVVVLRIKQHFPARIPALKEVSLQIDQQLTQQLAKARAAVLAVSIEAALNQGKTVAALSKQYKLQWISQSSIARDNKAVSAPILSSVFAVRLQKNHMATIATLSNGDVAVVKLKSIDPADYRQASAKQRRLLQENWLRQSSHLEYQLYTKSAYKNTKVKNYLQSE